MNKNKRESSSTYEAALDDLLEVVLTMISHHGNNSALQHTRAHCDQLPSLPNW